MDPVVAVGPLLAVVEDADGCARCGRETLQDGEHHRNATFHVGCAATDDARGRALNAAVFPVGHGVEMSDQRDRCTHATGARHDRVPNALVFDPEFGNSVLDEVSERLFVAVFRLRRDEIEADIRHRSAEERSRHRRPVRGARR